MPVTAAGKCENIVLLELYYCKLHGFTFERKTKRFCLHTFLSLCLLSSYHSAKFSSKIKYVNNLDELQELIPMNNIQIPECIIRWVPLSFKTPPLLPSSKWFCIHPVIWTLTSRLDKELKESADNSRWILTLLPSVEAEDPASLLQCPWPEHSFIRWLTVRSRGLFCWMGTNLI